MDWTLWRPAFLLIAALAIATVAVLGFRGSTSHKPPREFDKGMWVQPKAKVQARTAVRTSSFRSGPMTGWILPVSS